MTEYVYVASAYSKHDLDSKLCPWCIADGSAHKMFGVEFVDSCPLSEAGIDANTIAEVTTRTPGFISWQQDIWLTHCDDACVFLGDASVETVRNMSTEEIDFLLQDHGVDHGWFKNMTDYYQPAGQPAIYHFQCLQCKSNLFGMDYT